MNRDDPRARCYLEVDTGAILNNLNITRALLAPGAQLIAVLKADAYGFGAPQVGKLLYENGVRRFAVACLSEAFMLREALPEAWILCMGETLPGNIEGALRAGIRLTCGQYAAARLISEEAMVLGTQAYVHFKVDTGLHRIGFAPSDAALAISECARLPGITPEGLYTHLALHNKESDTAQHAAFEAVAQALEAAGVHVSMRHMLDSIGLTRYPAWQYNAVRVGAMLYGNYPNGYADYASIKPTARFCARVTRVFSANQGDCIGYDSARPLARDSRIATVSAGYADGYPRVMSGKGEVIVRGGRAKVLGLICMDQLMVDVTDIPDVHAGDIATLLGDGITLREYAEIGAMNRNECTAIISKRVPRIYL